MTTTTAAAWPREIRRYTLFLILLIAALGVVTTGYVFFEKRRSEQVLLVADKYHLASAFHATAAREETQRILRYVLQLSQATGGGKTISRIRRTTVFARRSVS